MLVATYVFCVFFFSGMFGFVGKGNVSTVLELVMTYLDVILDAADSVIARCRQTVTNRDAGLTVNPTNESATGLTEFETGVLSHLLHYQSQFYKHHHSIRSLWLANAVKWIGKSGPIWWQECFSVRGHISKPRLEDYFAIPFLPTTPCHHAIPI